MWFYKSMGGLSKLKKSDSLNSEWDFILKFYKYFLGYFMERIFWWSFRFFVIFFLLIEVKLVYNM